MPRTVRAVLSKGNYFSQVRRNELARMASFSPRTPQKVGVIEAPDEDFRRKLCHNGSLDLSICKKSITGFFCEFVMQEFEYRTTLHRSNHLLTGHRILGISTLPGMAVIELTLQVLRAEGYTLSDLCLQNILLERPITTDSSFDLELRISLDATGTQDVITVSSRRVNDTAGNEEDWFLNLRCKIQHARTYTSKKMHVDVLKQETVSTRSIDEFYGSVRKVGAVHAEVMRAQGNCFIGENHLLAELYLGAPAREHASDFYIPPVFLDGATLFPFFFHRVDKEVLYVPLCIETLQVFAPLEEACLVYVQRCLDHQGDSSDVLSSDYELYDRDGELAISITGYTAKRVRAHVDIDAKQWHVAPTNQPQIEVDAQENPASTNVEDATRTLHNAPAATSIESELCRIVARQLDQSEFTIDWEAGFYDLGMDSSHLLGVVRQLEEDFDVQLYPTLLFEQNTIQQLASYLNHEFGEGFWHDRIREKTEQRGQPVQKSELPQQLANHATSAILYESVWQKSDYSTASQPIVGPYVVFDIDRSNTEAFSSLLSHQQGDQCEVILVTPAEQYQEIGPRHYEVQPGDKLDYLRLLQSLEARQCYPQAFLNLWARAESEELPACVERLLQLNFYSACLLVQTLMEHRTGEKLTILSVSPQSDRLTPRLSECFPSAMNGFVRTLRNEYPRLDFRVMAIEAVSKSSKDSSQVSIDLMKTCLHELQVLENDELEVRYNSQQRWVKRFSQIADHTPSPHPLAPGEPATSPWKEGGVYLITGGLGKLGLQCAGYLARQTNLCLVLNGRRPWDKAAHEQVQKLEVLGAKVLYIAADISQTDEVEQLVGQIKREFGSLNGVFHLAGTTEDGLIARKNLGRIRSVLGPKISGTINLDAATKDEHLDFFVVFASLAGVVGNVGQADYAYANCFMDQYMRYRESLRTASKRYGKSLSIDWPFWAEGGMSLKDEQQQHMIKQYGLTPLDKETGFSTLEYALSNRPAQVIVLPKSAAKQLDRILPQATSNGSTSDASITLPDVSHGSSKNLSIETGSIQGTAATPHSCQDIAIIGLDGRFPQADSLEEFWDNLQNGRDCITEIPADRWEWKEHFELNRQALGKSYSKWGGFINDVDKFDASFFGITPRVAKLMDPQERLFLETCWKTIEDAGYSRATLGEYKVGVYAGVMWGQYQLFKTARPEGEISPSSFFASIPNWVSYFLNLHGPSIALDTMCSSSLTAIIMACDQIRSGAIDMALAGGVNLSIHPNKYAFLSMGKFLSSDGRCRSFGTGGDGYVPGEGVGAVLLKRLSRAIEDGDNIYGKIIGGSLNHGGKTAGFSVPNPQAQADVVREALQEYDIPSGTINYVEAHGTGTSLGDPIEVEGLAKVFQQDHSHGCAIGSVKSNIGHLESAAGIAGLVKVLLQMKYKTIVPSIHSEELNPELALQQSCFHVPQQVQPWLRQPVAQAGEVTFCPRRAGVSSFGAGGANAHLVVEEYKPMQLHQGIKSNPSCFGDQVFVLSAREEETLEYYAESMLKFLKKVSPPSSDAELLQQVKESVSKLAAAILKTSEDSVLAGATFSDLGFDEDSLSLLLLELSDRFGNAVQKVQFSLEMTQASLASSICRAQADSIEPGVLCRTVRLCDLAYTLQVGKESMRHRLAIVVASFDDLIFSLDQFMQKDKSVECIFQGAAPSRRSRSKPQIRDATKVEAIRQAVDERQLRQIARLWVSGEEIPWQELHPSGLSKRISLPTYPFAREKCWISLPESYASAQPSTANPGIS